MTKSTKYSTRRITMFGFIKKLFGSTPVETPAPYKVETPKVEAVAPAKTTKPKAVKKPAVTARKPRAPKA
jgi:hypothetical protein